MTETSARESGTPETDAAGRGWSPLHGAFCYVHEDFARKLERERDAARAALAARFNVGAEVMREMCKSACRKHIDEASEWRHFDAMRTAATLLDIISALPLPAAPQAEGGGK